MEWALRIFAAVVASVVLWKEIDRPHGMSSSKMLLLYFCGVAAGGGMGLS